MKKYVAVALACVLSVAAFSDAHAAPAAPRQLNGIYVEPRADLSPGAVDPKVTQANLDVTICKAGYSASVRPPTSYTGPLEVKQIAAYGYKNRTPSDFELDHLISLELGGSPRDPKNLWPEPWEKQGAKLVPTGFGAESKDKLEDYLHRAVCAKRIKLVDAQRMEAVGWIAAANSFGLAVGDQTPKPTTTTTSVKPKPTTTTTTVPATTTTSTAPTTTTTRPPSTTTTTSPAVTDQVVTPGAFCAPAGATGHTSAGTPMVCKSTATDSRNRWRAA
ncbi:MAG: hypothetical protein JWN67_4979 [Actinomycetia bacterium]|nr:hypothetical protein [Actinomycetes bacterium]